MIQSVARAIDLLEAVAELRQGAGVTELAKACRLKIQTAHTILKTLASRGLLVFDPQSRRYRLGIRLCWLADHVAKTDLLSNAVYPHLEAIYARTGETVAAVGLIYGQVTLIASRGVDSPFTRQPSGQIMRHPGEMATGRLLLSRMPAVERERLVKEHIALRLGPEPHLTSTRLAAIIAEAGRRGVISLCNRHAGLQAIAVAVPSVPGFPPLALGCNIPLARYTPGREREMINQMRAVAKHLATDWTALARSASVVHR